jgi:ABC-type nitrate/sulfonate/bicarbonate transport system permease component
MGPSFEAFVDEFVKIAEENKRPGRDVVRSVGAGLLGFGVGTAAGLGTGYLADKAWQKATGKKIPSSAIAVAAPLLGTASGIAYAMYKAKEQEAIRRALENSSDKRGRSVSDK